MQHVHKTGAGLPRWGKRATRHSHIWTKNPALGLPHDAGLRQACHTGVLFLCAISALTCLVFLVFGLRCSLVLGVPVEVCYDVEPLADWLHASAGRMGVYANGAILACLYGTQMALGVSLLWIKRGHLRLPWIHVRFAMATACRRVNEAKLWLSGASIIAYVSWTLSHEEAWPTMVLIITAIALGTMTASYVAPIDLSPLVARRLDVGLMGGFGRLSTWNSPVQSSDSSEPSTATLCRDDDEDDDDEGGKDQNEGDSHNRQPAPLLYTDDNDDDDGDFSTVGMASTNAATSTSSSNYEGVDIESDCDPYEEEGEEKEQYRPSTQDALPWGFGVGDEASHLLHHDPRRNFGSTPPPSSSGNATKTLKAIRRKFARASQTLNNLLFVRGNLADHEARIIGWILLALLLQNASLFVYDITSVVARVQTPPWSTVDRVTLLANVLGIWYRHEMINLFNYKHAFPWCNVLVPRFSNVV
ncbi:hypothetical protein ml_445 [Mollivirus sibericum]|uniref:hypothetical protein n=1 Tax=Mollivirus sibericum TaxID=1678078 RepID=UPI0006B2E537|nr:hypothetical protein ml_445 [Mollivirus sibericum]ALD62247.1 hypothetical protein ml_445 [Mollivirus sibericum]